MQIVQIVPKLPPSISGVGDYAVLLARQLQLGYGIDSRFVLVSDGQAPEMVNDFAVSVIQPRARLLPEALRGQPVCLHYVGYGYQKRGYAAWLARGLRTWKRENRSRHLITMFHEIFATGRIWNSSFWLSRLQRRVACAIANTSDALLTNRQAYADTLAQFAPSSPAPVVIPVLSTVGEATAVSDCNDRQPWLVVFGGDRWAHQAFTLYAEAIETACDRLHIDRVIQIGSSVNHHFDYRPVEVEGVLPAEEISRILCKCKAGFLSYYPGYLSKSTIFAAYCAHGVVPIFPTENNSERDGLFRGTHYLLPADLYVLDVESTVSSVTRNIREWYRHHDLKRTAKIFAETLKISPA